MIEKHKIIHLKKADSTNNYAQKLLDDTPENICNTVVYTDYQSKGRGAYQNFWESENAKNLLCSIIFCPNIEAKNQFTISKIVSLSLISYLKHHQISAKIKWPNDIFVKNKKIAGILIENSIIGSKIKNSIIGVGLNINQTSFSESLKATSILLESNKELNIKNELLIFLNYFNEWKNHCLKNNYEYVNSEYFKILIGKNDFIKYKKDETIFEAIIENIDDFGRIIVKTKQGKTKTFGFKEIEMIY